MGVTQTGGEHLERSLDPALLMARTADVLADVLGDGKDRMVEFIETRGTLREWEKGWGRSTRTASIPGRDDTGQMKSDVIGEVTSASAQHVRGILGWPDGSPEYYRHQENGFFHTIAQRDVEEMNALRDASEATTDDLVVSLTRLVRETL